MALLIVGSVALDTIKTPYGHHKDILGGSATHASVSASFYTTVNLVGVVGEDFPEMHVKFLSQRGIDISGLEIAQGQTFRWSGYYENDMSQAFTLDTQLNVFSSFNPKIPHLYKDSRYVFLANIHPALQLNILDQLGPTELVAMDTMNLWIDSQKVQLENVLKRVDLLFINDAEIRQFTGEKNLIKAGKKILEFGVRYVVIKKGEHGSMVIGRNVFFACPAYPVEALADPTGAGDTFAGGFMGYLEKTRDLSDVNVKKAAVVGTVMSSFNVEDFSLNRLRVLSGEEIVSRYNELSMFTSFEEFVIEQFEGFYAERPMPGQGGEPVAL